jgi:peroxiredoxin
MHRNLRNESLPMKYAILLLALLALPFQAQATEPTLAEKLDTMKQNFSQKADDETKTVYEEGVRLVTESGALEKAKNVGDTAPVFTLPDATGNNINLANLLKKGPVVLIWYRGEWCPYCNIQLEDIQKHIKDFKQLGAEVVAISPELPDNGWRLQEREGLEFHVLSDAQSKTAETYGVIYTLPPAVAERIQKRFDIHTRNDDTRNVLPLAATYVINTDGIITYAFLDGDYRKRAETTDLLAHLKTLKK